MKFKTMMVIKAVVCLVMGSWLMFFYNSIAHKFSCCSKNKYT